MNKLYEQRAAIFKALCDPKRQKIIETLQSGKKCAGELVEAMGMPQSTLSYHMKILCDSGIVIGRENGKWTYYEINEDTLRNMVFSRIPQLDVKEILTMSNFEKNLRRLVLAGIGATANSIEQVNDFISGKSCEMIDKLAEKGEKIVNEGKEVNEELHQKVEQDIDEFCDKHRHSPRKIDVSAMTADERAELLRQLQDFREVSDDNKKPENDDN